MRIGIISDTHGLLRPEAERALQHVDLIIHAGDIGKPEVLERLKRIAPVSAVRGNVDTEAWARELPANTVAEAGGASLYVLHNLHELDLNPRRPSSISWSAGIPTRRISPCAAGWFT